MIYGDLGSFKAYFILLDCYKECTWGSCFGTSM